MIHITIACAGKIKEKYLRDGIAEYEKRLKRYCRLHWAEINDEPTIENASETQIRNIKEKEGSRFLKVIPDNAFVIALDLNGKTTDSPGLAEKIKTIQVNGFSHIVFVIGGSLGLSDSILKRSDFRLSFSELTFPHQLMRLILLEQIYRSFRIISNEPYHK